MQAGKPKKILKSAQVKLRFNVPQALAWAAATYGKGRYRQLWEIAVAAFGRQKLTPKDYFSYGMFRPSMDARTRKTYVSSASNYLLNKSLSPPSGLNQTNLLSDKLLCGYVLERAGFPVMPTIGFYSQLRTSNDIQVLRTAEDIAEFFQQPSSLPCFGKSSDASLGIGAASFLELRDNNNSMLLGDGRVVPLADICGEIAVDHAQGYIFQPLIRQHEDVEAIAGTMGVAMLRIVTLRMRSGISLLYAGIKFPAKGEMFDALTPRQSNSLALLDPETGAVLRAQDQSRLCTTELETSLVTDAPLVGHRLPFLPDAVALAKRAHGLFPGHGILGFDIAITESGPVLNEINSNAFHEIYQRAADRGILNDDFAPLIAEAQAETDRIVAEATQTDERRGFTLPKKRWHRKSPI